MNWGYDVVNEFERCVKIDRERGEVRLDEKGRRRGVNLKFRRVFIKHLIWIR